MTDKTSKKDKHDGLEIEDIKQSVIVGFGEGAAICQVCGTPLREGDAVLAYVFRAVSEPSFEVGCAFCKRHDTGVPELWTLGVYECVVRGRVGACSVREGAWRVEDFELVRVSPACAVEAYSVAEWWELQAPAAGELEASGAGAGSDREVNELLEPADSLRPSGEWGGGE